MRFVAALLLVAASLASAQELTKQAKIERILSLTNANATMDQVFNQVKSMTASQLPPEAAPEKRARALEAQAKILDLLKARMDWDKMRPQYVKIYDELFSEQEIDGVLAFYQSPAGRALLDKMPMLLSKTMSVVQGLMGDIMPEIQRITKEAAQ